MARTARAKFEPLSLGSYHELRPSNRLNSFVECYWQAQGSGNPGFDTYTIIPDGCIDVVYEQQGVQVRCLAFGTTTCAHLLTIIPDATYFGVRFKPGMARHFLDLSSPELTNRHVELPTFLDMDHDEIAEIEGIALRRVRMELALSRVVSRESVQLTSLDRAICAMQQQGGAVRVYDLATCCDLSPRQLERRVTDSVGLSPKLLLRVLRIRAALAALRRHSQQPLADLAISLGYHDQAHMNRDFRLLTDHTPSHYRAASAEDLQASNLVSLTVSDFSKT